jgi:acyl-CoA reductase-like NAD-dependent aldehyde dehydrogenase
MSSAVILANPNEIVIQSPANGVEIGRIPVMSADEVRAAVGRAREAQVEWAKVPVKERAKKLRRYRDELLDRTQELVDLLVAENGKTPEEAVFMEMLSLTTISTWYCAKAKKLLKPKKVRRWGPSIIRTSYVHYEPRGVIGVISPWNFPLTIPLSAVFPALLAGNAVVVKPSEWTPLIMLRAKEIFDRCGIDPELLQVVTGYGPTGQALIEAGVDKVHFTGSTNVGKKIAAMCGERLVPVTLELGGKAPAIVCDDANLDRTVNCLTWGGFGNSGQVCISVERVLVDKKIAPELTRRLVESIGKLRQGDPTTTEVDVGAMTFPKQVDNVERLVEDSRQRGAKILTGGFRLPGKGRYYAPTLIAGVTPAISVGA